MSNLPSTFGVFRQVFLLALLGLAAVVLVGPVVAVLSVVLSLVLVVLPFALIGFVVWTLVQVAVGGKRLAWHNARELGRTIHETVEHFSRRAGRVLRTPLRFGREIGLRAAHLAEGLWRAARTGTRMMLEVAAVTATGLLVGGGMDLLLGSPRPEPGLPIPWNALLGGAIGCLAGVTMVILERRAQSGRENFRTV